MSRSLSRSVTRSRACCWSFSFVPVTSRARAAGSPRGGAIYIDAPCARCSPRAARSATWCANSATATETYGDINTWDTSIVTDMKNLFNADFSGACGQSSTFNALISSWDTSSVTTFTCLFRGGTFNSDISPWNTESVVDFSQTFRGSVFNSDISGWTVNAATTV